uniref:AAA+ ATPase domain-containing protein n=1 Tax=Plectus sambesii TaxID=2011161 RepID=A0A914X7M8_9BILA
MSDGGGGGDCGGGFSGGGDCNGFYGGIIYDTGSSSSRPDGKRMMRIEGGSSIGSTLHVEIRLKRGVTKNDGAGAKDLVRSYLLDIGYASNNTSLSVSERPELTNIVEKVIVGQSSLKDGQTVTFTETSLRDGSAKYYLYRLKRGDVIAQEVSANANDEDHTVGSHQWELPNADFDDMWENLVFEDNIKNELLTYVYALLQIADKGLDSSILTANRVVLLHGPPGTGKTTLCKALAQRLAVRMNGRYRNAIFVEINSHSLFSKWFSESGKLVAKMFEQVCELLEDPHCLVFVLIDEVESLTMSRQMAMNRNEPSDSVRAVNALLTEIDRIRRYPNVLVLTTSNLSDSVDPAFLDRADIKRLVPPPSPRAIYVIFLSCVKELQRGGLVDPVIGLLPDPWRVGGSYTNASGELSYRLLKIAEKSVGLSGRTLRKLPVLAYSKRPLDMVPLDEFLDAMEAAVSEQFGDCQNAGHIVNGDSH